MEDVPDSKIKWHGFSTFGGSETHKKQKAKTVTSNVFEIFFAIF